MNKRTLLIVVGALALIAIVLPIVWWLISPLFIERPVSEAFPTGAPPTALPPAEATEMMSTAVAEPTHAMEEAMPAEDMATASVLAAGEFYNVIHDGHGTATIYQLADGSRVLRLDPFEVLNGPDLHVYLVGDDPVPNGVGYDFALFADLGSLKGDSGAQNYALPAELDLAQYKSVVIWCQPFKVPFVAAALKAQ